MEISGTTESTNIQIAENSGLPLSVLFPNRNENGRAVSPPSYRNVASQQTSASTSPAPTLMNKKIPPTVTSTNPVSGMNSSVDVFTTLRSFFMSLAPRLPATADAAGTPVGIMRFLGVSFEVLVPV
ncbi:uncharacterized protein LOC129600809 [Paramacrobiotus metropolitanus]|uniref:uncharacterized protein LOC129600809 n=1 Tax=Paramacrobiotus metropolitanus TaxID=2943436 RepID=UPI0024462A11|nr:uncharacterized protein LOC129600809 [Paramacrobiotus metropolitanus]